MRYLPQTQDDIRAMLARIGIDRVDDLFQSIPDAFRLENPLDLPPALSEMELVSHMQRLQNRNVDPMEYTQFLGGGAYRHHTPSLVNHLILRGEFMTCYTPYQPEVSQGTLQAIFEFQSLICMLTGMEIANASMYDGASALAEAILMAQRITRKKRVCIANTVHPQYRKVAQTYSQGQDLDLVEIPHNPQGKIDIDFITRNLGDDCAAVVIQSPNYFGVVENYAALSETLSTHGVLLIVAVAEPLSLGILKSPGDRGADIVVGEGQSFGLPLSFGGPYVGFFATREKFFRQMPGRVVGETVDHNGQRAYTLTLATREQHIRREKATSNICTNQGLCALAASIYLTTMGKQGLRDVAIMNLRKSDYLKNKLAKLKGYSIPFESDTFNEFVLKCPTPAREVQEQMVQHKILAGIPLAPDYPELSHHLLVCATETNSADEMDRFVNKLAEISDD